MQKEQIHRQLFEHLLIPDDSNIDQAQRLFHGRGHAYQNLHHICIDWLPPVALITLFAPEPTSEIKKIADDLQLKIPHCKSVQLQHRYLKHGPIEVISGKAIQQLDVLENQLKFQIDLNKNRNTGLFLDMKNGRSWIQNHSKGKRVLNLFAYTCGFSVAAISGEARSVFNIDMSSPSLNIGRENHRLNNQSLRNVRFEKLNIFKSLGRIKKHGRYDLLICDPPTFQKGSVDILRDYPKIMRKIDQFMSPESSLMLCLNAPHTGKQTGQDYLIEKMKENAPEYIFKEEIKSPKVYVDAENKGLKTLIFKRKKTTV